MALEVAKRCVGRDVVVYVVDDDSLVRRVLRRQLQLSGIVAVDFGDTRSFLAAFDAGAPACVIVDASMSDLDGFQLQQRLRDLAPAAKMIFCAAHGSIEMSVRAMREGAVTFLEKPFDAEHMVRVVHETLDAAAMAFDSEQLRRSVDNRLASLTVREREVLRRVIEGLSSQQIAHRLGTSVKTIDVHRARIKAKSDAASIGTLVHDILRSGIEI